jgi:FkbM family methyltransferase
MNTIKSSVHLLRTLAELSTVSALWPALDEELSFRSERLGLRDCEDALARAEEVVVYGAGDFARSVLDAWNDRSVPVRYLVDTNKNKWGSVWQGYPVKSPEEIRQASARTLVVVACMDVVGISTLLEKIGVPFVYAERDGTVGALPGHLIARSRAECERVAAGLADDRSRFVFLSVLLARMFQEFNFPMRGNLFTDRCASYPQYFPEDLFLVQEGECFVDCGVFDGDSLTSFAIEAWRRGVRNWSALGFEADGENAERARYNLAARGLSDIPIECTAIGTGEENIGSLHLHNCRGEVIEGSSTSSALDRALEGHRPTLIKMDIEGAEIPALIGACGVIKRERPKLAVCTYHSTAELFQIPLFLMDNHPFYNVFMRHHKAGSLWETVCYAVPKEGRAK